VVVALRMILYCWSEPVFVLRVEPSSNRDHPTIAIDEWALPPVDFVLATPSFGVPISPLVVLVVPA